MPPAIRTKQDARDSTTRTSIDTRWATRYHLFKARKRACRALGDNDMLGQVGDIQPALDTPVLPRELMLPQCNEAVRQFLDRFQVSRSAILGALRKVPAFIEAARGLDPRTLYVVEWPKEAVASLQTGHGVWNRAADGTLEAAIRAKNGGGFVKHLRLREAPSAGINLAALNNLAVQSSLAEIIAQLEELATKMDSLLAGQRSDRHAQVDAGEHIYFQALQSHQKDNREHLLRQAILPITVGRSQLLRSIQAQSSVLKIPNGSAPLWGETPTQKLSEVFADLRIDLHATMVSTRTLVMIHEELGEPAAASEALRQLAVGLRESAPKLRQLAKYVPYSLTANHEQVWSRVQDQLVPTADTATRRLEMGREPQSLAFEFAPADFLEGESHEYV